MSLQVWLPLNVDLRNQGISNIAVTNNGATYSSTGGKLGGCYYFGGTGYFSSDSLSADMKTAAFWVKLSNLNNAVVFADYKSRLAFGIYSTYLVCSCVDSSGPKTCYDKTLLTANEWIHVAIVKTSSVYLLYINGVLQTPNSTLDYWSSNISDKFTLGARSNGSTCMTGYINDFRLYDHCLSAQEVKEISKGLVLHLPLSDRYIENTTNLITADDCLSATCYNGATSKYSYGETTNMYKTVGTFQGRKCTKVYNQTSGTGMYPYVYINNMYTSNGTNAPEYKTLSFDYYSTISTSICPYKLGNGTGTATYKVTNTETKTGTGTNSVTIPVKSNMWNHVEITFHGTTDADAQWGYIQNQPSHTASTSNYWLFANMQLEAKDHATGYAGVNSTRTSTIVKDVSGYRNNGIITGNLDVISGSPRYTTATHFSATTQKILIQNLVTTGFSNSYTFSWWGKTNAFSGKMFWGFADGVRLNGIYNGNLWNTGDGSNNPIYKPNTTTQVSAPSLNEWHHFVMVGNGTSCLVYLDGVLWGQAKTYKSISGTKIYFNGWDSSTSYTTDNMAISDFRMYATALTANDVLSLYNNGAYIDSAGNIHGQIR